MASPHYVFPRHQPSECCISPVRYKRAATRRVACLTAFGVHPYTIVLATCRYAKYHAPSPCGPGPVVDCDSYGFRAPAQLGLAGVSPAVSAAPQPQLAAASQRVPGAVWQINGAVSEVAEGKTRGNQAPRDIKMPRPEASCKLDILIWRSGQFQELRLRREPLRARRRLCRRDDSARQPMRATRFQLIPNSTPHGTTVHTAA